MSRYGERFAKGLYAIQDLYGREDLFKTVDLNKGFKFFMPVAFRASIKGGWLSPRGIFAPNVSTGYDHVTLYGMGLARNGIEGTAIDLAFRRGWVQFSYHQRYTKFVLNTDIHIHKTLTITMDISRIKRHTLRRLDSICREFERLLPGIRFCLAFVETEFKDNTITSKPLYQETFPSAGFVSIMLVQLAT